MKQCDLVMKGGLTSGIVYPGAVYELSREFSFANIGGTSAGAIAAALTAAAEYRRQGGDARGFDELRDLPDWLAGDGNLLGLFRPAETLRPLYDAALSVMGKRRLGALGILLQHFNRFGNPVAAIGAIAAAIAGVSAWMLRGTLVSWLLVILTIGIVALTAIGCVVASLIEAIVHAKNELPKNNFGISRGEVLTQWLEEKIRSVANIDRPLTFGDLAQRGVNLEMMTTNLTHGRPYRLPAKTKRFFFSPAEMRVLFPESVVQWLVDKGRKSPYGDLYSLPAPDDLPVIVATRMSLSFPVLLSAVPLYAIDFGRRKQERVPERCWFSDGGITSNFPVHFFDAPLPSRPTFAFNLAERTPRYHKRLQQIYTPKTNRGGILEWWAPIADLPSFLTAIVNTMQNWRDNMLLRMPGQRDRIAHVLLRADEGGLNLTMDRDTIRRVAKRGRLAAATLRARYRDNPPAGVKLTWRNHQWVRLRSFMFAAEEALDKTVSAYDHSYEELFAGTPPSYEVRPPKMRAMAEALRNFTAHAAKDFDGKPFRLNHPKPAPVLRAMPPE